MQAFCIFEYYHQLCHNYYVIYTHIKKSICFLSFKKAYYIEEEMTHENGGYLHNQLKGPLQLVWSFVADYFVYK